jgi:hypothetical protein
MARRCLSPRISYFVTPMIAVFAFGCGQSVVRNAQHRLGDSDSMNVGDAVLTLDCAGPATIVSLGQTSSQIRCAQPQRRGGDEVSTLDEPNENLEPILADPDWPRVHDVLYIPELSPPQDYDGNITTSHVFRVEVRSPSIAVLRNCLPSLGSDSSSDAGSWGCLDGQVISLSDSSLNITSAQLVAAFPTFEWNDSINVHYYCPALDYFASGSNVSSPDWLGRDMLPMVQSQDADVLEFASWHNGPFPTRTVECSLDEVETPQDTVNLNGATLKTGAFVDVVVPDRYGNYGPAFGHHDGTVIVVTTSATLVGFSTPSTDYLDSGKRVAWVPYSNVIPH